MRPGVRVGAVGRGAALFVAFSAAVFLAVYLLPWRLWPWLGLGLLLPAGLCLWKKRPVAVLLCLGLAAGLLWCGAYRAVFFAPAQALDSRRTQVTLCLSESPTPSTYGAVAKGWVLQPGRAPVRGILYAGAQLLELSPGDTLTAQVHCTQTALQEGNPFDFLATRGVFVEMTAQGNVSVEKAARIPWWALPRWWGEALAQRVRAALPDDVEGLLVAIVTGDRSGIDDGLSTALARSGVSHVVAVSGMHVCFLVGLLTLLTGHGPRRRAAVCVPALIFFTLAVGAVPSVVRACCFQLAVLLADLLGRETERWISLFGTLSFLLLLDPFSAGNIGLQLSFAAVVGLNLITPKADALLCRLRLPGDAWPARRCNSVLRFLCHTLAATLGALCFTVPLCAYYFGAVSLAAPLTNLLVVPVASLLFAGALVVGLAGFVWPAGAAAAGAVLALPGRYVLWVVRGISAFPYSAVSLAVPYYLAALLGAYGLLAIALFGRSRRRLWVFLLCAAALLGGSILFSRWSLRTAHLTAAVLDVGQGQSVVLASSGETALIDCGGNSAADPGDVCADYLNDHGEGTLDKLILTHYHADHTNGLDALFRRLEIREVILPRMEHDEDTQIHILNLAQAEGAAVTWLERDSRLTLGEADLTLYAPLGDGGANEEGLSVLASAGNFRLLITGDMNTVVERRLVEHAHLPRCQVIVAGHHGSKYASCDELLDAARPQAAVISVGKNGYGHPAPETLARLESRGVELYRTDYLGTVTIQVN